MTFRRSAAVIAAMGVAALGGCSPADEDADIRVPPAGAGFDYQLGGVYDPPAEVGVVARDSTVEPVGGGVYDICYVNGFQTQPGDAEHWLAEHPELVLRDETGGPIADPDWPD